MKRSKPKSRGADDSGALAEAELTALEADISQLQVGRPPLSFLAYSISLTFGPEGAWEFCIRLSLDLSVEAAVSTYWQYWTAAGIWSCLAAGHGIQQVKGKRSPGGVPLQTGHGCRVAGDPLCIVASAFARASFSLNSRLPDLFSWHFCRRLRLAVASIQLKPRAH